MLPNLSFSKKRDCYSRVLLVVLLCVDLLAFIFAYRILALQSPDVIHPAFSSFVFMGILSWVITAGCCKLYSHRKLRTAATLVYRHLEALPLFIALQAAAFLLSGITGSALVPVLTFNFYALASAIAIKGVLLSVYIGIRKKYRIPYVIVGHSTTGKRLKKYLQLHRPYSYAFMGYFDNYSPESEEVAGRIEEVYDYCLRNNIEQIYLAIEQPLLIRELLEFADNNFIYFGYAVTQTPLHQSLVPQSQNTAETTAGFDIPANYQTIYV